MPNKDDDSDNNTASFLVTPVPADQDPNELHAILLTSLSDLYGDLHPHQPLSVQQVGPNIRITCKSVRQVQAALVWWTPPPYLTGALRRWDLVVEEEATP